jgi:hypothetical protein
VPLHEKYVSPELIFNPLRSIEIELDKSDSLAGVSFGFD